MNRKGRWTKTIFEGFKKWTEHDGEPKLLLNDFESEQKKASERNRFWTITENSLWTEIIFERFLKSEQKKLYEQKFLNNFLKYEKISNLNIIQIWTIFNFQNMNNFQIWTFFKYEQFSNMIFWNLDIFKTWAIFKSFFFKYE